MAMSTAVTGDHFKVTAEVFIRLLQFTTRASPAGRIELIEQYHIIIVLNTKKGLQHDFYSSKAFGLLSTSFNVNN